jgi:hypothetical protein
MLLSNSKESPGFSRGESQKPVKHDSIFGYSAAKILLVEPAFVSIKIGSALGMSPGTYAAGSGLVGERPFRPEAPGSPRRSTCIRRILATAASAVVPGETKD